MKKQARTPVLGSHRLVSHLYERFLRELKKGWRVYTHAPHDLLYAPGIAETRSMRAKKSL